MVTESRSVDMHSWGWEVLLIANEHKGTFGGTETYYMLIAVLVTQAYIHSSKLFELF